ncbi:MAG: 1-acyl-sn-glycerol-3-phosphate acyltransferase, partial [Clostridia bacterium]|nr:1-acyl-sn-glycerol-3-phosphate acyltransferase [Clostridia bacterium]
MDKKEKNKNNIGLPNKVAWIAAEILFRIYFFFKGVRFDNTNVKQITKQCVFISPHFMDFDPMLLSCLLFPRRTTFIVSYHLYHIKGLDKLIPLAHCICKKQFANDPGATRKILRAYKEGNNIGIFPEGREGPYGKNVNVADGTATLFRKMGLDIFRVYIEGAYKSKPKWALYKRKWHIRVSMEKVADGEAVKAMSEAEVQSLIEKAIAHDGEKDCPNHQYKSK